MDRQHQSSFYAKITIQKRFFYTGNTTNTQMKTKAKTRAQNNSINASMTFPVSSQECPSETQPPNILTHS